CALPICGQELPATLAPLGPDRARVEFAEPPRAIPPCQAVVFYDPADPTAVLGGGTIEATERVCGRGPWGVGRGACGARPWRLGARPGSGAVTPCAPRPSPPGPPPQHRRGARLA